MLNHTVDIESLYISHGKVWRVDIFGDNIAAAADYKVGITTGVDEVVIFNRRYSSTAGEFRAALYEVAWTGGSTPQISNRRLSVSGTPPATVKSGVTATLNTVLVSSIIRAGVGTGNAQAGLTSLIEAFILKANTSYVIQMENLSQSTADIDTAFDIRADRRLYAFSVFGG